MQASSAQVGMLITAIVTAIFAAVTLIINYRKHRVEVRARGSKTIRQLREKVDDCAADVERLGDTCPQELTFEHELALRWLGAQYAVQMSPEEMAYRWRILTHTLFPIMFMMVASYQFVGNSRWILMVAAVLYWGALAAILLIWLALQNASWRVDRQRMLYARLGGRAVLPQIRPVTGNPWVSRVPGRSAVDRWIRGAIGPCIDFSTVTDEHVHTIQASIDQWYATRRIHRIQKWFAELGRKIRDHATDPVRLR